jgi:hypothetical protein
MGKKMREEKRKKEMENEMFSCWPCNNDNDDRATESSCAGEWYGEMGIRNKSECNLMRETTGCDAIGRSLDSRVRSRSNDDDEEENMFIIFISFTPHRRRRLLWPSACCCESRSIAAASLANQSRQKPRVVAMTTKLRKRIFIGAVVH